MTITVTDYLDVVSSWCFWSEPTWVELKRRYDGRVQFQWKIALMDPSGLPTSRDQEQWFYRRSGMMMRSGFMLNTDWYDPSLPEWLAPNCVAEAAKDFGFTDDRVRLALARAALREGKNVADWNIAAEIAAEAAGIGPLALAPLRLLGGCLLAVLTSALTRPRGAGRRTRRSGSGAAHLRRTGFAWRHRVRPAEAMIPAVCPRAGGVGA